MEDLDFSNVVKYCKFNIVDPEFDLELHLFKSIPCSILLIL